MNGRNPSRRRRSHSAQMVRRGSIGMQIKGDMVGALQAFEEEIKTSVVKSGAWAGATVMQEQIERRVPVGEGDLKGSIYRKRLDNKSVDGRVVYAIGPNKRKAPHWHLIEYGHWLVNVVFRGADGSQQALKKRLPVPKWIAAQPYIRPAFNGHIREALRAMKDRMGQRLREIKQELRP